MAGQEPHRGGPAVFDDVNKPRYRNYKFGKTADDRDRASILIYIKDIPVNSAFPRAGVLNRLPEPLHRYVNYAPVGLEYHDDGRTSNIYGNDAAQELLTEFDSVIDFGRNGSQLVQTRFTDAFGQDAIRGMNLDEMLSLVILWCHSWFTSRNRFLESSLNSTPGAWQRMPVYRDNQRRTNLANDNLHAPNIEIDALWVCVPSIYTVAPAGRHTRGVTNSCFRNMYRLNRVEALSIMHIAKQKDAIGNSTRYGRIFRWITYFITQYVRWKATVFEQYARMLPHNHLHLTHEERKTYQANQWDQDGGRQIEG
ncbi:hypothetical protein F4814DRAFT_223258 [Daldinia grandis]|nr:hypothetical protein F4814DRAFT_223258 [Daldinia grandis]